MENINKDKFVDVYICSSDWETNHRKEFCKAIHNRTRNLVLIQFPVSLSVNLMLKFKKRFLEYLRGGYKTIRTRENIVIFSPYVLFHPELWLKSSLMAFVDSYLLGRQINNFLKSNYGNNRIRLWVYRPYQTYLIKHVKFDKLVYDAYDDNEYDYFGNFLIKHAKHNAELIRRSDLTTVVSKFTYDRYLQYSKKIIYLRNGYNPEIFKKASYTKPPEFVGITKPKLGFAGGIRNWLDFDLIKSILDSDKFVLVLIGYISRNARKLFAEIKGHKNLIHIDFMPIEKLPQYINYLDAGLLPYVVNNFTKSVYPLKFFEYVASGIPVVTTALPEMKLFEKYIGYSISQNEFLENCEKAVSGYYDNNELELKKLLQKNTWEVVVNEIFDNLNKV